MTQCQKEPNHFNYLDAFAGALIGALCVGVPWLIVVDNAQKKVERDRMERIDKALDWLESQR